MGRIRNACVVVLTTGFALSLTAHASAWSRPGSYRGRWSGDTPWIVVEVMNPKGEVSYEAIEQKSLQDRVARENADYQAAREQWKKDKSIAEKARTKFIEKAPIPGHVLRVQTAPATFKSQSLAATAASELTRKMTERKARDKGKTP